jgi:hypothetical protein
LADSKGFLMKDQSLTIWWLSLFITIQNLWSILEDKWMRTRESATTLWVVRVGASRGLAREVLGFVDPILGNLIDWFGCHTPFPGVTVVYLFLFQTVPFYMLYIIYWVVGVSLHQESDHREPCPRSSMPWSDMCVVQVSTTRRPLPRTQDSEDCDPVVPRTDTDSTDQWVWCLMHMWSMLHVISVICLGFRV